MLNIRLEMLARETFKLLDKLLAPLVGNMVREQKSVDQKAQLRFGEFSFQIEIRPDVITVVAGRLRICDRIADIQQIFYVVADSLAVQRRIERLVEFIQDVFLVQRVVLVCASFENVQDHGRDHFLLAGCHNSFPAFCEIPSLYILMVAMV